jgi:hypothetical protein
MKSKIVILMLAGLALTLCGCQKKLFHFVVPLKKIGGVTIEQKGEFMGTDRIKAADIRNALKVPEDGTITGVDIESVQLRVIVNSGNAASWLKLSGYVVDKGKPLLLFENKSVSLVAVNAPYIGLNSLIETGVNRLKEKINDQIKKVNEADIEIGLSGDSDPAGQQIDVDIEFLIVATVKYDQCVEVFDVIGGEDCTE